VHNVGTVEPFYVKIAATNDFSLTWNSSKRYPLIL